MTVINFFIIVTTPRGYKHNNYLSIYVVSAAVQNAY